MADSTDVSDDYCDDSSKLNGESGATTQVVKYQVRIQSYNLLSSINRIAISVNRIL